MDRAERSFKDYVNRVNNRLATNAWQTYTQGTVAATLPSVAKAEVIEYTDDFDGEDSTSIDHVWYNRDTERLTVRFRRGGGSQSASGGVYSYDGVPWRTYQEFDNAPSLGQFHRGTFRRTPGDEWPGVKHNDRTVSFQAVVPQPPLPLADLDALKPDALTMGRGKKFGIHFQYSGEGDMVVRAPDMDEAISRFEAYMNSHGFDVEVTTVTLDLREE